ncbi:MAG: hypothetical protein ACK4WH_14415 [Phycisphaerales bacterium]
MGITMQARIALLPSTSPSGQTNLGVSRVGGPEDVFRITANDPAGGTGFTHGSLAHWFTNETRRLNPETGAVDPQGVVTLLTDISGEALRGHFAAFRGSFAPQVPPLFLGSNADRNNGQVRTDDQNRPYLTRIVASHALAFGTEGSGALGVATIGPGGELVGDFADIHRLVNFPDPASSSVRDVTLQATGMTGRYIYHLADGTFTQVAQAVVLQNRSVTFTVPAPSAGAPVFATLWFASSRRRRSAA